MNKPEYIGFSDWQTLLKKYNGEIPIEIEKKLTNKYPIQYIIGNVEFYNTLLTVDESVLIPRYETELLIQKTVNLIKNNNLELKIIDLGTGSGAIAISLAKEFNIVVDALDISADALRLAKLNALTNGVSLKLLEKDLLNDGLDLDHSIIISNPPYVDIDEDVDPQTKYEPQNAIFAGKNGLEFYERIINLSSKNKKSSFWLIFEIGASQKDSITKLILDTFPKADVKCEKDFSNRDRYIFANISK